jgi:hypothetical protein
MDITKKLLESAVIYEGDIECQQCGVVIRKDVWMKNFSRNRDKWDYCKSCKAKPVAYVSFRHPVLGLICCVPHRGELDDSWTPLNAKGEPFRPGFRVCGNRDCVSPSHIVDPYDVSAKVKEVFRKTGKLISLEEAGYKSMKKKAA